ncbi:hypothetical protein C8R43DRAFT_952025 [Mycena crocata]|nr:hypothetical protein C8R43DRAFT_952025 [Mycena crocata]
MRFLSISHVLCALVIAVITAPVKDQAASAIARSHPDSDGATDVFGSIDGGDSIEISSGTARVEEVDPDVGDGCCCAGEYKSRERKWTIRKSYALARSRANHDA